MRVKTFFTTTMLICICCGFQVFAQSTKTWVGITTNWNDENNWSPVGIPNTGDNVVFDDIAINDCYIPDNTQINSLTILEDFFSTIFLPAGNFFVSGNITIQNDFNPWDNNVGTVILNGTSLQTLSITPPENFPFYNLTIENSHGVNENGVIIEGELIGSFCTPPVTGGIYHISNNFSF